jgi:hypothetical protein
MNIIDASSYTTLNAAVDALPATGGVVYLPPQDYNVTSTITVGDDITIIGASWDSIVKWNTTTAGPVFALTSANRSQILNLQIDGQTKGDQTGVGGTAGAGVHCSQAVDCRVSHCYIHNIGDPTNDATNIAHDGVSFYGATRFTGDHNYITDCARNGMAMGTTFSGGVELNLHNNNCYNNRVSGIALEPLISRTTVRGNLCRLNLEGGITTSFGNWAVKDVSIIRNQCFENDTQGIGVLGASTSDLFNLLISDNVIQSVDVATSYGEGIILRHPGTGTMRNVQIRGNLIEDTDRDGIIINPSSTAVMQNICVDNNTLYNTNRTGNTVNSAIGYQETGASVTSRGICIRNNTIYIASLGSGSDPLYAIAIAEGSGANITGMITGNFIDHANSTDDIYTNSPAIVVGPNFAASWQAWT